MKRMFLAIVVLAAFVTQASAGPVGWTVKKVAKGVHKVERVIVKVAKKL